MRYKRLLVAVVLLAAGCSKPKPPVTTMPNIGCQESDTRNCAGESQITGNAYTRTPNSPAVTGGRNIITYESNSISTEIADLKKRIQHNQEGDKLIADCVRQKPEEWVTLHCDARKKAWLKKQAEFEKSDKATSPREP